MPTLRLAQALIQRPSLTPEDAGCQVLLAERLAVLGFKITHLPYHQTSNLWATYGQGAPIITFAGHTDVVPTGPESQWTHPPFDALVSEGYLYGRGAADMKGALAAMIVATERFLSQYPEFPGTLAFLLTSDEEGPACDGTIKVLAYLKQQGITIDYCILGEPSSEQAVGDRVKIGSRGSLSGHLTLYGRQSHIAYAESAKNPIHHFSPILERLISHPWDKGTEEFPPTSFQCSNVHAGTGAGNVIPGSLHCHFNFRFSPASSIESLKAGITQLLASTTLPYTLSWDYSGPAFVTPKTSPLVQTCVKTLAERGIHTRLSTHGGTSDGRFIAPTGTQVIELGLEDATIHAIDERVSLTSLDTLTEIYYDLLVHLTSHKVPIDNGSFSG
jgi:succinyl-diaminopimelate desuccinylase